MELNIISFKIKQFANNNGSKIITFGELNKYSDINLADKINPIEWANIYSNLSFSVTDRLHSTIFSLKKSIPFLVIDRKSKYSGENKGEIIDLLTDLELLKGQHLFLDGNNAVKVEFKNIILNFAPCTLHLAPLVNETLQFLINQFNEAFFNTRFNLKAAHWHTSKNGSPVLMKKWLKNRFHL